MTEEHIELGKLIEEEPKNKLPGPGQRLRAEREARNMDLEEVAKHLRLSFQRLALIEADDYAQMGASAFARGYLRSYARFLNLPEVEIMQSFDDLGLGSDIHSNVPKLIHEKMTQHVSHPVARRLGYLLFLALVAAGGFWWHNHVNGDKNSAVVEDKSASAGSELNEQGISQVADPLAVDANKGTAQQGISTPILVPANSKPAEDTSSSAASLTPITQDNAAPPTNTAKRRNSSSAGAGRNGAGN